MFSRSRTTLAPTKSSTVHSRRNGAESSSVLSFTRVSRRRPCGRLDGGGTLGTCAHCPAGSWDPGFSRPRGAVVGWSEPAGPGPSRNPNVLSVLVSVLLSTSPSDGTPLDIRSFGVVKQSSGKDDYYKVESGPDGPYLAARYHPPFDTMVRG